MAHDSTNLVKSRLFGSVTRKAVMLVLADYTDAAWSTFVGQARIAAEAEVSERTVRTVLADFETEGLIVRTHRARRGELGGRTSDRIQLERDVITDLPEAVAAKSQTQPATDADPNGKAIAGEQSVEPQTDLLTTFVDLAPLILSDKSDPDTGLKVWVDSEGKVRRREDGLWDAACEIWGRPKTGRERARRNKEIKELRDAGVHPEMLKPLMAKASTRWKTRAQLNGIITNLGDLLEGIEVSPNDIKRYEGEVARLQRRAEILYDA